MLTRSDQRKTQLGKRLSKPAYFIIKKGYTSLLIPRIYRRYETARDLASEINGIVTNRSWLYSRIGKTWKAPLGLKRFQLPEKPKGRPKGAKNRAKMEA